MNLFGTREIDCAAYTKVVELVSAQTLMTSIESYAYMDLCTLLANWDDMSPSSILVRIW